MRNPLPGRVQIAEGVEFGTGGGRPLRCDVYTPPDDAVQRRSVLLLHGGGWAGGDRQQLRGYGILLGRLGFLCVSAEYRLSGEATWPAQIHDVKAALRWMRAEHESLGVDPDRIAVSGNSAGAHLSLMLAATPHREDFEGEGGSPGVGTECAASIAIYAPTDLLGDERKFEESGGGELSGAVRALVGEGADARTIREASPVHYARKDFPPTQLLHGNADTTVPSDASLAMYRALKKQGAPVELHMFNGAPHGFDADPDLGRQCAQLIALFLDRHVPA